MLRVSRIDYSGVLDADSQGSSAEFEDPIHPDELDRALRYGGTFTPVQHTDAGLSPKRRRARRQLAPPVTTASASCAENTGIPASISPLNHP